MPTPLTRTIVLADGGTMRERLTAVVWRGGARQALEHTSEILLAG